MSATNKIRAALKTENRLVRSAQLAKELGIDAEGLRRFIFHDASLEHEMLQSLVQEIWQGGFELDIGSDQLVQVNRGETRPMAPGGLTPEYQSKPTLDKEARTIPIGAVKLDREAKYDPKLDKLRGYKTEAPSVI